MSGGFYDPYCRAMLEAALVLASQGFSVFPCVYAEKAPRTKHGFMTPRPIRRQSSVGTPAISNAILRFGPAVYPAHGFWMKTL